MGETVSLFSVQTVSDLAATVYLSVCAAQDLRRRRISLAWSVCMGALAMAVNIVKAAAFLNTAVQTSFCGSLFSFLSWSARLAPGCLLLLLAVAAEGSAGTGDGICFLIVGAFTDARTAWILLAASLCLASLCGMILMCLKKADRKSRLPFLLFAAAAWCVVLLTRLCRFEW